MGSHTTWSVSLGRWGGLHIRLHSFFLLFAAFTMYLGWRASNDTDMADGPLLAGVGLAILFGSVLLHELGHLSVARRLGGDADELVLGPFGGMAAVRTPPDAQVELLVHLAGPAVNFVICLLAGALLFAAGGSPLELIHPLSPRGLIDVGGPWIRGVKLVFWVNWILFLVNLLPAFPFDGGRALRAGLTRLRPDLSPARSASLVAVAAKMAALALLVGALIVSYFPSHTPVAVPTWFALLLLAIFLYFSAKQEEERQIDRELDHELFGYDFSQGFTSLERSDEPQPPQPSLVQTWLEQRRRTRETRRRQLEADEESRVDEILSRLHGQGMQSLSADDQALLQRVSARYRQRR